MPNRTSGATASLPAADGADGETPTTNLRLEELVLAAFIRAGTDGRHEVAERLLRALEALCPNVTPSYPPAKCGCC